MTQKPTNDLRERIDSMRKYIAEVKDTLWDDGYRIVAMQLSVMDDLLSDLSALLTPSDSDVKGALEIVEDRLSSMDDFEEDAYISIDSLKTIRAAILGLSVQLAEKEREIGRLRKIEEMWNELEKQSQNFARGFEGVNWDEKEPHDD